LPSSELADLRVTSRSAEATVSRPLLSVMRGPDTNGKAGLVIAATLGGIQVSA
jgi:hypothetical protein